MMTSVNERESIYQALTGNPTAKMIAGKALQLEDEATTKEKNG
jgi:hypothetical protein